MIENNETEYIYVVLIKALTGVGKLARKITRYDYTHIAVSLDKSLTDFISFSRRNHYLALDAGIMHEFRGCYAYGDIESFKAKVFRLPVTREKLLDIKEMVYKIENDNDYMFNLFSMITMPIIHGFRIHKTHNCMSFTALIISKINCVKMDKAYYKYSIKDMDSLLKDYLFFEGNLKKDDRAVANYMTKPRQTEKIKVSLKTISKLLARMISTKNEI